MSEVLANVKQRRGARFIVLSCGHWYKWTSAAAESPCEGDDLYCPWPQCRPITMVKLAPAVPAKGEPT